MIYHFVNNTFQFKVVSSQRMVIAKWLYVVIFSFLLFLVAGCGNADVCDLENIKSIDDLKGRKTAVITGSIQDIAISQQYPDVDLVRFSTPAEILLALETGKADYCVIDTMFVIDSDIERRGIKYLFHTNITQGNVACAMRHGDTALCRQFNEMLAQMKADGSLDEVVYRWTHGKVSEKDIPSFPPVKGKPLRIGVTASFPLTHIKDGHWAGLEIEMVYRFSQWVHRPVEISNFDFAGIIAAINTNKVDMAFCGMLITPERQKQVLFSDSYLHACTSCLGRFGATKEVQQVATLEELRGKKVSVLMGGITDMKLTEFGGIDMVRINSNPEAIMAVETGVADFAAIDSCMVIGCNLKQKGLHVHFASDISAGHCALAFSKNNPELRDDVNRFMQKIKDDGTLAQIVGRWTSDDAPVQPMPQLNIPSTGEPLRVGTCNEMPVSFIRNGENCGMVIEVVKRYAEYAQRPVVFYIYDFSSLIPALQSNKIDIMASNTFITKERCKEVLFSEPFYYCKTGIIGRVAVESEKQSKQSLTERLYNNLILESRWKLLLDGLWTTLVIAFFSILGGTILGCGVCWLRMSKNALFRGIAKVYIEIMRNLPILVFLMVVFYVVFANSSIGATVVAIVAFSMNFAAFVSEMFRVSVEGVDVGQTEAALAMGFSKVRAFFTVVVPQAVRSVVPVYKGEVVSLVKNTSIVGYIAIQDLTKVSDIIRSRTFDAFAPLIVVSIIYFLIAFLLGKGLDRFAKKKY